MADFCGRCGSKIDNTGICHGCGTPGEAAETGTPYINKRRPRLPESVSAVLTVFLSICLFVTLSVSLVLMGARSVLNGNTLEMLLDSVGITELLTGTAYGEEGGLDDLCGFIEEKYSVEVPEEKLEEIIEESDVKSFIADKLSGFSDVILEESELKLTKDELSSFLSDNADVLENELGVTVSDSDIEELSDKIMPSDEITVKYDDIDFIPSEVISVVEVCTSTAALGIFISLSALFIVLMLIISVTKGLCGVGVDFIVIGALTSAVSLAGLVLPALAGGDGLSLIGVVGKVLSSTAPVGIIFLAAGIGLFVTRYLILRSRRKKAS